MKIYRKFRKLLIEFVLTVITLVFTIPAIIVYTIIKMATVRRRRLLASYISEFWIEQFESSVMQNGRDVLMDVANGTEISDEQMNTFKEALERKIMKLALRSGNKFDIYHKYDANGLLAEALRDAGIRMRQGAFNYYSGSFVSNGEVRLQTGKEGNEKIIRCSLKDIYADVKNSK